jgi:putative aminopeptidase FrvX
MLDDDERAQMTDFLQTLVQTPSPSTQERAVAELIQQELHRVGVRNAVTDCVGNVVARLGNGNGPTLRSMRTWIQ